MVPRFEIGSTRLYRNFPTLVYLKISAIMLKRFSYWASSFRHTKTYPNMKECIEMLFDDIGQSECLYLCFDEDLFSF